MLIYGSHKWRDGVHKWYFENLYVMPVDSVSAQTWGIGWYTLNTNSSRFTNNTMVNWAPAAQFHYCWSLPLPYADFTVADNKYFTPGNSKLPFKVPKTCPTNFSTCWTAFGHPSAVQVSRTSFSMTANHHTIRLCSTHRLNASTEV